MSMSDWSICVPSRPLDQHIRKLNHLVDLAMRGTRESPWYTVYCHVLTFMAARSETEDAPLYVWPQCSLFAEVPIEDDSLPGG